MSLRAERGNPNRLPATDNRFLMAGSLGQKEKGSPARDDRIETRETRMNREWEMHRSQPPVFCDVRPDLAASDYSAFSLSFRKERSRLNLSWVVADNTGFLLASNSS